jgi:CheY-like chemotaxis protein
MTPEGKEVKIMIVEDNPSEIELAMRALKKCNLDGNTLAMKDGTVALDYLFRTGEYHMKQRVSLPKVIFMDMHLPKMDGLDIIKKIRENEVTKNVPIVAFTLSQDLAKCKEAYLCGLNSYLMKSDSIDQFVEDLCTAANYWVNINFNPDFV